MRVGINFKGLGESAFRQFDRQRFLAAVQRQRGVVMQTYKAEVQATIKRKDLRGATGRLLSEIIVENPPIPRPGFVGSDLVYAPVMELGRKPNGPMPPVAELKVWVERKPGLARATGGVTRKGRQRKPKSGSKADKAQWAMAWAIAKSIAKKGIKGRYYWRETKQRVGAEAQATLTRLVMQELRRGGRGGR